MKYLVTGGAGFIGSNLVDKLLGRGDEVRVLDNLSTGHAANLNHLDGDVHFVEGDVRDPVAVGHAAVGVDAVYHLAALPSVSRSVGDPASSHEVNATGTLNVLVAAQRQEISRVVYASSSSLYGDAPTLPKHEDMPVSTRSPYAASKLAGEAYCRSFAHSFEMNTVALRFFNVFGPRQDPNTHYAAVVPRFITAMLEGRPPEIFGDGLQSRDFTFIDNAVDALALASEAPPEFSGEAMNVGCGSRTSLRELASMMSNMIGTDLEPSFCAPRPGDVLHSEAAIAKAKRMIGYTPSVPVDEGIRRTISWFAEASAEKELT